nr:MAG: cell division protease [Caudoviricetes sp.]
MNKNILSAVIKLAILFGVLILVFNYFKPEKINDRYNPSYTRFIELVQQDKVFKARIQNDTIQVLTKTGDEFIVFAPNNDSQLINDLLAHKVDVVVVPPPERNFLFELFISLLPVLLLVSVWIWFARKQTGGRLGSIGNSKAKLLEKDEHNEVTFADVAGCDEAKEELREVIDFLKNPEKFNKLGGKVPKGVLLTGDPGTGKTLLSKAVAHEAGVPFYYCSGSDFVEMFVGVGSSRVRDMFVELKKNESAILFIDEIDAVGKSRSAGMVSNDERDQTLNALLVEMDGFGTNSRIIVIAATNRPDILDKALLRPGRFDRQISVGLPDLNGRKQILEVHTKNIPTNKDLNLDNIARGTSGFSGAELANLVNEAIIFASREGAEVVSSYHFERAKDKVLMGVERKTFSMSESEKRLTAVHESAHAIVGYYSKEHDPIYKVSIVPRGRALGITMFLPENDSVSISKTKLESQIASLYAGRIGEEMFVGKDYVTTGASNDIERATLIATKMITEWGMGSKLIPMVYVEKDGFTGESKLKSGFDNELVQKEIQIILQKNYKRAESILRKHWKKVELMTQMLMEFETIDINQIEYIMAQ